MKLESLRAFREKITTEGVVGPFSKTEDPAMIECMGHGGFDFCIIDMEHGPHTVQSAQHLVRAAELAGLVPILRVSEGMPSCISAALDIGAGGVQVPQITSGEAARAAVDAARYAPKGQRGVCRYVRNANYSSIPAQAYFAQANEALLILQLEGREALTNMDEILAVDGIDIIFVGPYDLSQSLGVIGQPTHPKVVAAVASIVERCAARGILVGTFVESPEQTAFWAQKGVRYLCYSVDVGLFTSACSSTIAAIQGAKESSVSQGN